MLLSQYVLLKHRTASFAAFGWIGAESKALHAPEFNLLLLSAVTSSISTKGSVPLAAIHARAITLPPPCLTHDVVSIRSQAVSFFLHTFLFLQNKVFVFLKNKDVCCAVTASTKRIVQGNHQKPKTTITFMMSRCKLLITTLYHSFSTDIFVFVFRQWLSLCKKAINNSLLLTFNCKGAPWNGCASMIEQSLIEWSESLGDQSPKRIFAGTQ